MLYTPWLQGHHVALPEMLDGREARAFYQNRLLTQWNDIRDDEITLVCFTLNIAGPIKVFPLSDEAFAEGCRCIEKGLERLSAESRDGSGRPQTVVLFKDIKYHSYGHEAYYLINGDSIEVKKVLTEIEESHPFGRLFDIDVLRPDGTKVSRQEIGYPARKCLLCGEMASDCARSRTHTVEELQAHTVEMILAYIKKKGASPKMIGQISKMALLQEVYTTPKPGLVDRANNGAHKDMDVALFEKSAEAIEVYFASCHKTGMECAQTPLAQVLSQLRPLGIRAEKVMFAATEGVNTHKGMIFSLGIICGAIGWMQMNLMIKLSVDNLLRIAGEIAYPVLEMDFKNIDHAQVVTAGERQYLMHGISGIRGEAAGGFRSVAEYGVPYFKQCLADGIDFEESGCLTLLNLVAHVTDTNIIARSNVETQKVLQNKIRELLADGKRPDRKTIEELDAEFIRLNVSPGGCADLLAITYFLWLWEQIV